MALGIEYCNIIDPWKPWTFDPEYKLWRYSKNLNLGDNFCGEPIQLSEEERKKEVKLLKKI